MAPLQVIGAGFGRTGTDSLCTALNILGYNTHHMKCFYVDSTLDPDMFYEAYLDRQNAKWDKMYENYTAAVDWPTAAFWEDLYRQYPNAKVILTVRSADSWYQSIEKTIHKYVTACSQISNEHPNYRLGRMTKAVCVDGKLEDPNLFSRQDEIKQIYLDHIEHVKRTVPKDRLLIMELGEGWDRLCEFLGKPVPNEPYPNVNSTLEFDTYFTKAKLVKN